MRVLIVGGAGFIGCALASRLKDIGIECSVLDSSRRIARSRDLLANVECVVFDYTQDDPERVFGGTGVGMGTALVHLGCATTPARSMQSLEFDARSNIVSSLRLFDAAESAAIGKVVFASSGGTVYGAPGALPVSESAPTQPISAYGISKLAIEQYLSLYKSITGISLRIANPYGPYQLRGVPVGVIARYVQALRSGEDIEVWGDGGIVRDYIAIEDLVDAICRALCTVDIAPGAYNVGSGFGASINDVIQLLFTAADRRARVRYLEARKYDVPAIILHSDKLGTATGWTPATPLGEGLARLWEASAVTPQG